MQAFHKDKPNRTQKKNKMYSRVCPILKYTIKIPVSITISITLADNQNNVAHRNVGQLSQSTYAPLLLPAWLALEHYARSMQSWPPTGTHNHNNQTINHNTAEALNDLPARQLICFNHLYSCLVCGGGGGGGGVRASRHEAWLGQYILYINYLARCCHCPSIMLSALRKAHGISSICGCLQLWNWSHSHWYLHFPF